MKKIIFLLFSVLFFGQKTTINVTVPKNTDEVYVTGNQESLGNWDPAKIKMEKISDSTFSISANLKFPAEFKFTRGNWQSEGIHNKQNENFVINSEKSKTHFIIKNWKDQLTQDEINFQYTYKYLTSQYHPEEKRRISIFLPEKYNPAKKYPVIYTLDAESLFRPTVLSVAMLSENADYEAESIPETIVVGISNTSRFRDFNPNTGEDKTIPVNEYKPDTGIFYKILTQEIVPYINKNYAVSGYNAIMGHSDTGHFVTMLAVKDDPTFQGIVALSVNEFDNQFKDFLLPKLKTHLKQNFFLGYGTKDKEFNEFAQFLEKEKIYNENLTIKSYNASHIQMPNSAIFDGVKTMFRDYRYFDKLIDNQFNDNFNFKNFEESYIEKIKNTYGIDAKITFDDMFGIVSTSILQNNPNIFNKLMDEIDKTEMFQLQFRFYLSNEASQNCRAKSYLYKMLESNDETDKLIFFANLKSQYQDFFVNKIKNPVELISFIEKAKTKWPQYTLEFNYLIAKTAVENNIEKQKAKKYINYCSKNFKENRYFTKEKLYELLKSL